MIFRYCKVGMAEARELLKRFGKADCPVWITELGGYAVGCCAGTDFFRRPGDSATQ